MNYNNSVECGTLVSQPPPFPTVQTQEGPKGRIDAIKFIRTHFGLGLKDGKDVVDLIVERQTSAAKQKLNHMIRDAIREGWRIGLARENVSDIVMTIDMGEIPDF